MDRETANKIDAAVKKYMAPFKARMEKEQILAIIEKSFRDGIAKAMEWADAEKWDCPDCSKEGEKKTVIHAFDGEDYYFTCTTCDRGWGPGEDFPNDGE